MFNSLHLGADYFVSLEDNTFATLVESYYQCTATWFTAINNAIGIATGTANNFSANGLLFIAYSLLLVRYIAGKVCGVKQAPAPVAEDEDDEFDETVIGQVRRTRELKLQNMKLREEVNLLTDLLYKLQHQLQTMEEQQKVKGDKLRKEMKKLKAANCRSPISLEDFAAFQ